MTNVEAGLPARGEGGGTSSTETAGLGAIRAQLASADEPTRRAGAAALLACRGRASRDALHGLLGGGGDDTRRALVEELARRRPSSRAKTLLELLDQAPRGVASSSDEAREHAARIAAELARILLNMGDPERARELCAAAVASAPAGLSPARAAATHQLGRALRRLRHFEPARAHLRSALEQYERLGDPARRSRVLDSLGTLCMETLDLEEAEHFYRSALRIKLEHGDLLGQSITCSKLGRIERLRGEYDRALEELHRARNIATHLGDLHGQSLLASQVARVDLEMGNPDRAWEALEAAAEAARQSPESDDEAQLDLVRGAVALERGALDIAHEHLCRARAAFDDLGLETELAEVTTLQGALERTRRDLDAARLTLAQARSQFAALGQEAGEARACLELALVEQVAGCPDAMKSLLSEAMGLVARLERTRVREQVFRLHAHLAAGRALVESGIADAAEVERLVETSHRSGRGLGKLLLRRGLVDEQRLGDFASERLGIRRAPHELLVGRAVAEAMERLPAGMALRLGVLPLAVRQGTLVVAMSDPLDFQAIEKMKAATALAIEPTYVPPSELAPLLQRTLAGPRLGLSRSADPPSAFRTLLEHAVRAGASDIHLEPKRDGVVVRMRVDGILQPVDRFGVDLGRRLLAHVKAAAGMDVTERRLPLDGRLGREVDGRGVNLRLSTLPCSHGEKLTARILGQAESLRLSELGLDGGTVTELQRLAERQEGMLVVVGPTGSGKSTTLAAVLQEVDAARRSVFTVEDPIEFEFEAFTQTQVNPEAGLGFAEALRALLRQDPNVILLGEMRDLDSATIAVRMALTGHLVLTTLHAYDAVSAITRLFQMGLPAFSVAAVVKGVLAQRLVRRLCPECKVAEPLDREWLRRFDPEGDLVEVLERSVVYGPKGCDRCHHFGYRGRVPVFEFVPLDDTLAGLVRDGATVDALRTAARRAGVRPMELSALSRVARGETSPAEVLRVL